MKASESIPPEPLTHITTEAGHSPSGVLPGVLPDALPGVLECRERGWYAVHVAGQGWRACLAGTAGAQEDLNRLAVWQATGQDCLYQDCLYAEKPGRKAGKSGTAGSWGGPE